MTIMAKARSRAMAEVLGGRDYLSYSAISTFQQCPLKFFYRYVLGLPERTITASLLFGQAMHRSAQVHFEQLLAGSARPDLDTLLGVFWDAWNSRPDQAVVFGKTEDIRTIGHLAERLLRTFRESAFARPEGNIIAVEEELRGELIPGLPDLLSRVDLVVETDSSLEVMDFKTARTGWSAQRVAESAGQLLLYSELVKHLSDGKPLRLGFAVLTKAKLPELTIHALPTNPFQMQRTKRIVEQVWRAIHSGIYYPNPSPLNCPGCPYREPCREWSGSH
jgi:CRISPR/Cas system-associated exonuclease Cas4 (RecB family)